MSGKPALMIALGGPHDSKNGHDEPDSDDEDLGVDEDGAAMGDDAIEAIKAKDGAAFYAAMRAIIKSC